MPEALPFDEIEEELGRFLDESLEPRGPEQLYEIVVALGLPPGPAVLDLGCGRGDHAVELARRLGATVLGVDPDRAILAEARDGLEAAAQVEPALADRVRFTRGNAEVVPVADGTMDLVWCRDVLSLVDDLDRAYGECARVLRPGGRAVVYQMFATERLEPRESAELFDALDCVAASMQPERTEVAIAGASLRVDHCVLLGSEWGEHVEEQSHKAGRLLLHVSRILRAPDRYGERFGPRNVQIKLGDCLWHVYRLLGKLSGRVYVLSKPG
jgi:SAM-dependent methyltransferase